MILITVRQPRCGYTAVHVVPTEPDMYRLMFDLYDSRDEIPVTGDLAYTLTGFADVYGIAIDVVGAEDWEHVQHLLRWRMDAGVLA